MEQDGVISTRGLKPDAVKYGELVFDVNSAYFYNHGGYEFAKQFYADAYKAAAEIVGGDKVTIAGFGRFEMRERQTKNFTNPKTKVTSQLEPTAIPGFKASGRLKEKVGK